MTDVELIRFDRKTLAFLALLVLLLVLSTAFKLHGSSIGIWNPLLRNGSSDTGVLLGTPAKIRSDEWGVTTPAMMSQARSQPDYPVANSAWGPERVPLIFNLPVRHWSMWVRPQFLGFFFLDLERGFAFYWGMKALLLVGGAFLLLMLLTRNDFGVSLLGSAWLFFSGFVQWWYSTPAMLPETVGCVALLLVAVHYVVLSRQRSQIAIAALVFSLCLLDATLSLYPPFQVPLFYLGIAVGAGSLVPRLAASGMREHLVLRVACSVVALATVGSLLALYFAEAQPTLRLMLGTAYPGTRTSSGGSVSLARAFSGFFGFFMTEASYPARWFNVCEASNFVLLFPVPMAAIAWRAWRRLPVSALEWSLAVYLVALLTFLIVGWPRWLALASGFGLTQGTRPLLGLGFGSIVLACVFLAERRVDLPVGLGRRLALGAALVAALALLAWVFDRETEDFATGPQLAFASLFAAGAGYLLLARKRIAFAALVLVPEIWSHGLVNPVSVGLAPILDTHWFRQVSPLVASAPDARWAIYGDPALADLIKATGARVWNGTLVVPPLDDLHVLDPSASAAETYNRYAHVELAPGEGPSVRFTPIYTDRYAITIDPRSEFWHRLGVRYVALPFAASDPELVAASELVLSVPELRLWIYEYRWR